MANDTSTIYNQLSEIGIQTETLSSEMSTTFLQLATEIGKTQISHYNCTTKKRLNIGLLKHLCKTF